MSSSRARGRVAVAFLIKLEPVANEGVRPYYRAVSKPQVLALLDVGPKPEDPEPGSRSLNCWRRRELNPWDSCESLNVFELLPWFVRVVVRVARPAVRLGMV